MMASHEKGGLVTLVVASTERSGGASRRGGRSRGGAEAGDQQQPLQWCAPWTEEGPGEVMAGCEGDPDLTLTLSPADAQQLARGELPPSVAYMQGRLKTAGDNALLLRVLRWSATPDFEKTLGAWLAVKPQPAAGAATPGPAPGQQGTPPSPSRH